MAYQDLFGIPLPEYTGDYHSTRRRDELQNLIALKKSETWELSDPYEPGDVALVRMMGRNCHIGLMLENWNMLHVQDRVAAVIEPIDRPPWKSAEYNKVEGIYRHASRS